MLQTLSYIINVAPDGVPQVVKLSQNENGRTLAFALTGVGTVNIPSGSTVTISGTKPDGVVYSATGTLSGNVASFSETTQMTAVSGIWPAKIKVTYNGETIATCKIVMAIDPDPVAPGSVPSSSQLNGLVAEAQQYATYAKEEAYGSPLVAATAAAMTDKTRVYVYTGSETGKTAGHWYFWNGSAWTDGGVYNSQGINTDTTLTLAGMAADAKATGDEFTRVKQDISELIDVNKTPQQGYVNPTNGNIYGTGGTAYYKYITIPVTVGAKIHYRCGSNESGAGMAFYNADDTYYGTGYNGTDSIQEITVPSGAKIAKLSYSVAKESLFYVGITVNSETVINVTNNAFYLKTDFATSGAVANYYANINNGNVYSQSGYSYFEVNVIPTATLVFKAASNESVAGVVFYADDGAYISGVANNQAEQRITVPNYAKTAKLDFKTNEANGFYAYQVITNETVNNMISNSLIQELGEVVVDIDGNGDYTSLLAALKNTPSRVPIRIKKGTYNILSEYEAIYGSDFFTNYSGYRFQTDAFLRGLWLGHGRKIVGESGVVISCEYTGSNTNVNEYFSVFANAGNTSVENVHIKFSGIRYAIHDDFTTDSAEKASTIEWKDIVFDGTPNMNAVIGGGLGIDNTYVIKGCVFIGNTADWDMYYHGSNSSNASNINTLKVTDCFGTRRCGIWDTGSATTLSTMYVSNSKFLEIVHYHPSSSTNVNTACVKWCNEEGA